MKTLKSFTADTIEEIESFVNTEILNATNKFLTNISTIHPTGRNFRFVVWYIESTDSIVDKAIQKFDSLWID